MKIRLKEVQRQLKTNLLILTMKLKSQMSKPIINNKVMNLASNKDQDQLKFCNKNNHIKKIIMKTQNKKIK